MTICCLLLSVCSDLRLSSRCVKEVNSVSLKLTEFTFNKKLLQQCFLSSAHTLRLYILWHNSHRAGCYSGCGGHHRLHFLQVSDESTLLHKSSRQGREHTLLNRSGRRWQHTYLQITLECLHYVQEKWRKWAITSQSNTLFLATFELKSK